MRTTVDLPDDLHQMLRSLAHERDSSLSRTVTDLLRERLGGGAATAPGPRYVGPNDRSGLPTWTVGRMVTSEDVRSLDDEA